MFKYAEQILERQKLYSELRLMQHLVDVSTEKCLINCAFFVQSQFRTVQYLSQERRSPRMEFDVYLTVL